MSFNKKIRCPPELTHLKILFSCSSIVYLFLAIGSPIVTSPYPIVRENSFVLFRISFLSYMKLRLCTVCLLRPQTFNRVVLSSIKCHGSYQNGGPKESCQADY